MIFTSVGRFALLINFKKSLNSLKCHVCSVFRGIVYSELNVTTSWDFSFFLQLGEKNTVFDLSTEGSVPYMHHAYESDKDVGN